MKFFFHRWLEKVFKRTVGANSEITLSDFKNIVQSKNVSYLTIMKKKLNLTLLIAVQFSIQYIFDLDEKQFTIAWCINFEL